MKKGYKRYLLYKHSSLLTDYLDGALAPKQKEKTESEFFSSPEDETRIKKLIELKNNLNDLPKVQASPQFKILLKARLRREQNRSNRRIGILPQAWRLPAYAAASVALVGVGMIIGRWFFSNETQSILVEERGQNTTTIQPVMREPLTESTPIKNYVVERVLVSGVDENSQNETISLDRRDSTLTNQTTELQNRQLYREASTSIQF
jgi:anti-sigma factor RsiW